MTASELYNNRELTENFGRSKVFESCRRMRQIWPGFPSYHQSANEFDSAMIIYIMAKSGNTTTRKAVSDAIISMHQLKCGNELFVIWLGNLLLNPDFIKDRILNLWIFQSDEMAQVTFTDGSVKIFQGEAKVKIVNKATQLSAAFLYDFAIKLKETWKDESLENKIVSESEENEE